MTVIAWDKDLNEPVNPERQPLDGEWAKFEDDGRVTFKHYFDPSAPVDFDVFKTANEQVTINSGTPKPRQQFYFAVEQQTISISVDIVDSDGNLQNQIDQTDLGYPTALVLPVVKLDNTSSGQIIDKVYFFTSINNGVMTSNGTFPSSGEWVLLDDYINHALSEISADWRIQQDDVVFRVATS